ncbi:transmembrane protein [PUT] [Thermoplasma volcanium GSS1]|uniref:NAD kinase n=1 Tax=Thermoplasma volcanium (strain ATCC 51530 / DSM 4299 / JCM 9571 / NBRC 15438 / GSS1) TaxID=273116 RepID=NADK_THEVO|nr:NAD(+) kinase [Thermoplasma volcanium]Q979U7.1 RecName: Full=NAD kinase; AltName: Full=ATP-dependent NAD kinase [Thermoplasma volcanium GSS1]BAB60205.1 transmembrane protein [PUT] [Thermoplasma volcanium GSS1]
MKVAFVIRKDCKRCATIAKSIIELIPPDWEKIYDTEAAKFLGGVGKDITEISADIIIAIGGDGTVLRILQNAKGPVLGINMGGLGFLTEIEIDEVGSSTYKLIRGEYKINEAMKLKVYINGRRLEDCTNEAVVHTDRIARIRQFKIYVDGHFLTTIKSDGVIVATPTGSSSYSSSAGGPLLLPTVRGMVISYLAPYSSRIKPVVVPSESTVEIKIAGNDQDSLLILDGQKEYKIKSGDTVSISMSEEKARFVSFRESIYDRLRDKVIKHVVN